MEVIGNNYHTFIRLHSQHNLHYVVSFYFCRSDNQIQTLQFFDMVFLCGRYVDPCGIDAAVSEDIRKVADVFMHVIVGARKEMAEVMRECFFQCNTCFFGVFFISVQMLLRSTGFPFFVMKTAPLLMSFFLQ